MRESNAKSERLCCSITPDGKRLLAYVAASHGMSISEYFVDQVIDHAKSELINELIIRIPCDAWDDLLAQLDEEHTPNEKLMEAARDFALGNFNGDVWQAPD